jgi:DNA-binding NtrC family response regulator
LASQAVPAICRILLRDGFTQFGGPPHVLGVSDAFLNLEQQIRRLAAFPARTVLITGERGAGKELAAWALHCWSPRRHRPFMPVLVSAFAEDLLADELFGHRKHAFTGALAARQGKFLAANGGTLFLDEVADLSLMAQSALLRVLETGEVPQIGRDLPLKTDVRILAATNGDLGQLIADGKFRGDLYDRLNTLQIHVPPLRARQADIPVLASHFLRLYCHHCDRDPEKTCTPEQQDLSDLAGCGSREFYEALQQYDWPGNVRELQNVLLKLRASLVDHPLEPRHLPGNMKPDTHVQPVDLSLRRALKDHIETVLRTTNYNQSKASKLLRIPLSTLRSKAKKLGVELRKS